MLLPRVSIVIPVYNTANYLAQCLDSVCGQSEKNIEIIIVDDCSPDDSWQLIMAYAAKDKRIVARRHEQNKGLGAARNTGIKIAKGSYIWFVDSDDFIVQQACELLSNTAAWQNVDILFFNICPYTLNSKGMTMHADKYFVAAKELLYKRFSPGTAPEFWRQFNCGTSDLFEPAVGYISRLQFLRNFQFRTNVWHEDTDFTAKLFFNASSIYGIHFTPYFYLQARRGSIMNEVSAKHRTDKLLAALELLLFCRQKNLEQGHYLALLGRAIASNVTTLTGLDSQQQHLHQQVQQLYGNLLASPPECAEDYWINFGRLSRPRQIWALGKIFSKKLHVYNLLKPLARLLYKFYRGLKK